MGYLPQFSITKARDDLDLLEKIAILEARKSFWAFRQFMDPTIKIGWFQRKVARALQQFYDEWQMGYRPKLVIEAPPQHGKSVSVNDLCAWVGGKHPDKKQIYASFSERLGVRANLRMQRMIDSQRFSQCFPKSRFVLPISKGGEVTDANYVRSRELLEFVGYPGYFRNTTVRGSVTGESLDLGIIDDPLKGRLEANSENTRQGAWDWFTDDFLTRFADDGALLIILTRWHVDDPVGRLIESDPTVKVLKFPAIAIEDEKYRRVGEPLFPELKSLEFLLERHKILTAGSWESLYQQSPFITTDGMFPIDKFHQIEYFSRNEIVASCRYWDKAGTKDGDGAETSGTLMHRLIDDTYVIEDVEHGRWAALEREERIKACAVRDGFRVKVYVEQEPGSGGLESAQATIRNLRGYVVEADRPTGDKQTRAEPYAAQVQGGNVKVLTRSHAGPNAWVKPFMEEHQYFPNGKLKDMVDSSSGAFNKIAKGSYDMEALGQ